MSTSVLRVSVFDKKAYMKEYNAKKKQGAKPSATNGVAQPGSTSPVGFKKPQAAPGIEHQIPVKHGLKQPKMSPAAAKQKADDIVRETFSDYDDPERPKSSSSIPSYKLVQEIEYAKKHGDKSVTVKIPSYSEVTLPLDVAEGLLGLEGKVTEIQLETGHWARWTDGAWVVLTEDKVTALETFTSLAAARKKMRKPKIRKVVSAYAGRIVTASAYETTEFNGRPHLVVPVVALVEGVIHASNSPQAEMVPFSEIERTLAGWNGRPLMMPNHPERDGRKVSANSPEVLEGESFGQVFEARVEDKKLKMLAYIDIGKAEASPHSKEILDRIRNAEGVVEVSVGAFVDAEPRMGSFNGKPYKAIWKNVVPDHLAFLKEGIPGACNANMGCGVRAAAAADEPVFVTLAFNKQAYMAEYNARRRKKANYGLGGKTGEAKFKARQERLKAIAHGKNPLAERRKKLKKQRMKAKRKAIVAGPPRKQFAGPIGVGPKGLQTFRAEDGNQIVVLAFNKAAYMKEYNARKKALGKGGSVNAAGPAFKSKAEKEGHVPPGASGLMKIDGRPQHVKDANSKVKKEAEKGIGKAFAGKNTTDHDYKNYADKPPGTVISKPGAPGKITVVRQKDGVLGFQAHDKTGKDLGVKDKSIEAVRVIKHSNRKVPLTQAEQAKSDALYEKRKAKLIKKLIMKGVDPKQFSGY